MKKYIKPEIEVIQIQSEGFLANSFGADDDITGPLGVPPRQSTSNWDTFTSDDVWELDEE